MLEPAWRTLEACRAVTRYAQRVATHRHRLTEGHTALEVGVGELTDAGNARDTDRPQAP